MLSIAQGAEKIVGQCAGVRPEENVLILTDTGCPVSLADALFTAAMAAGARAAKLTFDGTYYDGQLSRPIAAAVESADVLLCVTSSTAAYTKAVDRCKQNGCRVVAITGAGEETFCEGSIEADYQALAPVVAAVQDAFDAAQTARVTAPGGTALTLSLKGRRAHTCPGLVREKGGLIGLPGLEVYIAPVEAETNGLFVADASGAGLGRLEEPVRIEVRDGRATGITGGAQAQALADRLAAADDPNSYTVAEFAIGLNPCATLTGRIAVDEGLYGTGHFALGNNLGFGGESDAPQHLDLVYWKPTIELDGKVLMKEGVLVDFDEKIKLARKGKTK